jgi:predicted GNAT family N-acyltransferase
VNVGSRGDGTGGSTPSGDAAVVIRTGDWGAMRTDAAPIRLAVFVREQGCPESEEWDAHDAGAVHAVAYVGGVPVATGRLLPDARIGRMAVLAPLRRAGIGARVLGHLVAFASARGDAAVELSAQCYVRDFYARHGFVAFGPVYDDCGIAHQSMRRALR